MRLVFVLRVIALLALATLSVVTLDRAVAARRKARAVAARAADSASLDVRRLPQRVKQAGPPGANDEEAQGGPWYVICARHPGGYCSDPYFDFDTATTRAELHRRRMGHFGVGVATSCPY
jgi:hypothetical protein